MMQQKSMNLSRTSRYNLHFVMLFAILLCSLPFLKIYLLNKYIPFFYIYFLFFMGLIKEFLWSCQAVSFNSDHQSLENYLHSVQVQYWWSFQITAILLYIMSDLINKQTSISLFFDSDISCSPQSRHVISNTYVL